MSGAPAAAPAPAVPAAAPAAPASAAAGSTRTAKAARRESQLCRISSEMDLMPGPLVVLERTRLNLVAVSRTLSPQRERRVSASCRAGVVFHCREEGGAGGKTVVAACVGFRVGWSEIVIIGRA